MGILVPKTPDNSFLADLGLMEHHAGEPVILTNTLVGQIATFYYFLHFLVILPVLGLIETPKPLPKSISEPILADNK